jgi:hypothetical protein
VRASEIIHAVRTNTTIRCEYLLADSDYRTVSHDEAKSWASQARSELFSVMGSQIGDCDDYARKTVEIALNEARKNKENYAPAIGWYSLRNFGTNHAANIFLAHDHQVYTIEPQNGKVTLVPYEEGMFINLYIF